MRTIPEIVKEYVLVHEGRMPETDEEIDMYLDLINHGQEYASAFALEQTIGKKMMKKLGFKTPDQIIKEGCKF